MEYTITTTGKQDLVIQANVERINEGITAANTERGKDEQMPLISPKMWVQSEFDVRLQSQVDAIETTRQQKIADAFAEADETKKAQVEAALNIQ